MTSLAEQRRRLEADLLWIEAYVKGVDASNIDFARLLDMIGKARAELAEIMKATRL